METGIKTSSEDGKLVQKHPDVWTIGHSTRGAAEFSDILLAHKLEVLVDVRSFPGSRRCPQFNKVDLAESLDKTGITYRHLPSLGGRRKTKADSKNFAWKNPSFRAYADHMESGDFKEGINELVELAGNNRATIMCAEAVWWRCHRSLIADYLKASGLSVWHIKDATHTELHPYTAVARIVGGELSYEGLLARNNV
jgi:uncharacterized protein (DUF488 family)